jgi:uncharacterized protein YkwD
VRSGWSTATRPLGTGRPPEETAINAVWKSPIILLLAGVGWAVGHGVIPAVAAQDQATCFTTAVNAARAEAGVAALATDPALVSLAQAHSARMEAAGTIFHNTDLPAMVPSDWQSVGENVGMGGGCDGIAQAFLRSPEHRANILDPAYNHLGVGVAIGHDGTVYVTEDFLGLPQTPAP